MKGRSSRCGRYYFLSKANYALPTSAINLSNIVSIPSATTLNAGMKRT